MNVFLVVDENLRVIIARTGVGDGVKIALSSQ